MLRVLALSFAGLLLAACGTGDDTGNVLNRAIGPEPESLDPHHSRTAQAQSVQRDLFEGLVAFSPSGELVPGVAERWQLSDDGRRYTFELRRDARWSNGDAVTAADFVFSFRRLVDPATASFYAESLIAIRNAQAIVNGTMPPDALAVSAPSPHRLAIELERPVPYFLSLLAKPSAFPVHPPSVNEHGDSFARPGRLITNGAYKLDDWQLGAVIDMSRNEHYWNNAETAIDRVRHHVTVEPAAELYRYRAGELHITSTVPVEAYEQVQHERPDELHVAPQLGTYFYGLNLGREPFRDNPALRRALTMAIDREVLTSRVIGRGELPAYSWVPPGTLNYEPPRMAFAGMPADERIAEARRHYREAGYSDDNPVSVELRYNTSDTHERIALAVQSMWRDALGFEATLINEEFQVLVANMRAMEITEAFRLSWLGDYNDAYSFLSVLESDHPSNMYGYSSDEYDALLAEAAVQIDTDRRREYLQRAEQLLLDDNPVIPLYFHVSKHLVSPRVAGWQDNVLDFHYSQHLSLR